MNGPFRKPPSSLLVSVALLMAAPFAMAQQVPVETWLRGLAAAQKFELVVGKGLGGVMVTPPAAATPESIGEALVKSGVPFGFTTSKDGSRILILQLGIDALSKSVGIPGGGTTGEASGFEGRPGMSDDEKERRLRGESGESEAEDARTAEDKTDTRLQSKPALPPQADPDDPIEAYIDHSIQPLPKQIDMSDPDEAQVDPQRKPLPPQIDYNDPDEKRTPPPGTKVPPKQPVPETPPVEKVNPVPIR